MEKFVVYDTDDYMEVICDTRADAEEYILSLAEDNLFCDFCGEIHFYDETPEDVIKEYELARQEFNNRRWFRYKWETWYGYMLNDQCYDLRIQPVFYLED